jgi:hypothetical protein
VSILQCPVGSPERDAVAKSTPDGPAESACPVSKPESGRFIPYITPFKGEKTVPVRDVVARPDGLGVMYPDETPQDRDHRGALWVRSTAPAPGRQIPIFRKVHPRRAGAVMLEMRCQGCFGEPDRNRQGLLFFMKPNPKRRNLHWPDVEYTQHPPVCLPCVQHAMRWCPFVREATALRVRKPRPWGVDAFIHAFDDHGTLRVRGDIDRCSYDDLKLLPWALALQPIARLSRCTVVDIYAEMAAAGLEVPEAEARWSTQQ